MNGRKHKWIAKHFAKTIQNQVNLTPNYPFPLNKPGHIYGEANLRGKHLLDSSMLLTGHSCEYLKTKWNYSSKVRYSAEVPFICKGNFLWRLQNVRILEHQLAKSN
jgi:hypothetical protein